MSYNYPAPGNYGQQFNSGQAYAPQSYQPPPGAYSAPPPPGLGQPQPPGSYGIPPSGQHGAPPAPGQHAIQAPPYGTPPPAHYAPHAQYGAPGAPAGAGQMIGGPPRYDGSHSQGAPSQTPQPQPSITFRVTEPGKGILNSEVVDPWQRTGWTVSSPSKKETFIRNHAGDVVGRIEWHTWASSRLDFLGYHGKVKEFIPRGQRKHTRVIQYDEVDYDVVEDRESGTIRVRRPRPPHSTGWMLTVSDRSVWTRVGQRMQSSAARRRSKSRLQAARWAASSSTTSSSSPSATAAATASATPTARWAYGRRRGRRRRRTRDLFVPSVEMATNPNS
ncbi:hypothetical protein JB92DRAFT_2002265 [Gautieria morchelliformis]|nr:hypothetical protein JB92DRAFT_2002265 [Gautieria morchelliformis]